jgi:DNA-directed RNA polymerase specialized sigma24 family protein
VTTKDYLHEQLRQIADDVMDLEFALSEKRRQRDAMIVSARVAGLSLRMIGEACMISHQTVQNIVDRAADAAGATEPVPTTVDEPGRDE